MAFISSNIGRKQAQTGESLFRETPESIPSVLEVTG
jgi:hypothetical protein